MPVFSMEDGAADLVLRSRVGDQNATAIIAKVRVNASREPKPGDKKDADLVARARKSYHLILDYIKLHPVPGASIGEASVVQQVQQESAAHQALTHVPRRAIELLKETEDDGKIFGIFCKLCHYSNGPEVAVSYLVYRDDLHTDRLNELMKIFDGNEAHMRVFTFGVKNPRHQEAPMMMAQTKKDCFYPLVIGMLVGRAKAIQDSQRPLTIDQRSDSGEGES
jgi:hypothetical protein